MVGDGICKLGREGGRNRGERRGLPLGHMRDRKVPMHCVYPDVQFLTWMCKCPAMAALISHKFKKQCVYWLLCPSVISLQFTRGGHVNLSDYPYAPKKLSPNMQSHRVHGPWLAPRYLQAFELHREQTENNAGRGWRRRLYALVVLPWVQLSIMCRAQYGISFYVCLCRR